MLEKAEVDIDVVLFSHGPLCYEMYLQVIALLRFCQVEYYLNSFTCCFLRS